MLSLLLYLLLTFFVLSALLFGGTRLAQGALYEEVSGDLLWQAPAAAGAITAYLGLWAFINYAAAEPGKTDLPFDTLFNFTSETLAEQPVDGFTAISGGTQVKYTIRKITGAVPEQDYLGPDQQKWSPSLARDVQTILVKEGDKEVRFTADADHLRYVEEGGRRYLDTEAFGRISTPRGGGSFVRVLLNVLHFAVWFVALWLLLRFQWPHALALAAGFWLVMTFVAPYLLRAGAEAKGAVPSSHVTLEYDHSFRRLLTQAGPRGGQRPRAMRAATLAVFLLALCPPRRYTCCEAGEGLSRQCSRGW